MEIKKKVVYHGVPHKIYIINTRREINVKDGTILEVNDIEFKELMKERHNDSTHSFKEYKEKKSKTSGGRE